MSNIFQEVLTDAQGVEQRLLGPSYPYYKNILCTIMKLQIQAYINR